MGVNCRILLPKNVRVRDVADVIGRLSGLPVNKAEFGNAEGYSAHTAGVSIDVHKNIPEMVAIHVGFQRYTYYHFETEPGNVVSLSPSSCPFWIAVGKRLVDFFGGSIQYSDAAKKVGTYKVPFKSASKNCPTNGKPWYDLQDRKLALMPVTRTEFMEARKFAAYDEATRDYKFDEKGYFLAPVG